MIKSFTAKIGSMRKARSWVTYPRKSADEPVTVQAEGAIGRFDPVSRLGVLNVGAAGRHYGFAHLSPMLGASAFTFPEDFVGAALEAAPVSDGTVKIFGA